MITVTFSRIGHRLAYLVATLFLALAQISGYVAAAAAPLPDFEGLARNQSPTVVNISTLHAPIAQHGNITHLGSAGPEFLQRFYNFRGP